MGQDFLKWWRDASHKFIEVLVCHIRAMLEEMGISGSSATIPTMNDCNGEPSVRISSDCPIPVVIKNPHKDPELVCITNDNGETVLKGVVLFTLNEDGTWTQSLEFIGGGVATGYDVLPNCGNDSQLIKGDIWCFNNTNVVPFYLVETNGTPSESISFWVDANTGNLIAVDGSQTIGVCSVNLSGLDLYKNLSDGVQTSSFLANKLSVSYNTGVGVTQPIVVKLIGNNLIGNLEFEVAPNQQEFRSFKYAIISGVEIQNAIPNSVTIEFQLN